MLLKAAGKGVLLGVLSSPISYAIHSVSNSKFRDLKFDNFFRNDFRKTIRLNNHIIRKSVVGWTAFMLSYHTFFYLLWAKLPFKSDFTANVTGYSTFGILLSAAAGYRPIWAGGIFGAIAGEITRYWHLWC